MSNYYCPRCGKTIIDNGGTVGVHTCTRTTMKFIGYGKWKCNYCAMEYKGYITYCRDGCGKENRTDGKGNLIPN